MRGAASGSLLLNYQTGDGAVVFLGLVQKQDAVEARKKQVEVEAAGGVERQAQVAG